MGGGAALPPPAAVAAAVTTVCANPSAGSLLSPGRSAGGSVSRGVFVCKEGGRGGFTSGRVA